MRNLNKIILINSAGVPYSEILLDGNIHFTGTQGVGKSTILRAILFFYNADTQKLGIPIEKQSYTDYYFPFSNSYVVYEVVRETGTFCVLTYKAMNRVCFRFIDSTYRKEFFIDETNLAYSGVDKIRATLDRLNIKYLRRQIATYDEYRDIIYGNQAGMRDCSKYSLMESKMYQNIPRTIQNVFLNSKLDAEFVKQTIISSLHVEGTEINLNNYKAHLRRFEIELNDIEEFQKKENREQAALIAEQSQQIGRGEQGMIQLCRELFVAYQHELQEEPKLIDKQHKAEQERTNYLRLQNNLQEKLEKKCRELGDSIAVYSNKLKDAQDKADHYQEIGIQYIMDRVAKKSAHEFMLSGLKREADILTAQYQEVDIRYKALKQELVEHWNRFHAAKLQQQQSILEDFNRQREEGHKKNSENLEAFYTEFDSLRNRVNEQQDDLQQQLRDLDYRQRICRKESFYEKEQKEIATRLDENRLLVQQRMNQIREAQLSIKEFSQHWETEQAAVLQTIKQQQEAVRTEMELLRTKIVGLQGFLEKGKDTFLGWLDGNYAGWEENIGKVCDETLLWNTMLTPSLEGAKDTFYGISLNLDEVDKHVKNMEDYRQEKLQAEEYLEVLLHRMQQLNDDIRQAEEKFKRKFQPLIKEQKTAIQRLEYENEQADRQRKQDEWTLTDLKGRENEERRLKLTALQQQQQEAEYKLKEVNAHLKALNEQKEKKKASLSNEWKRSLKAIQKMQDEMLDALHAEEKVEQQRISEVQITYDEAMKRELTEQGADVTRLNDITLQIEQVKSELSYIAGYERTVVEYEKDKRELIDNIPAWRKERKACQERVQKEQEIAEHEIVSLKTKIDVQNKVLGELEEKLRACCFNQGEYRKISNYDWYEVHRPLFCVEECTHVKTIQRCTELVIQLTRLSTRCNQQRTQLRKEVSVFSGHFSEDNIFSFPTKFSDDEAVLVFAEQLYDFIEEQRIEEYIRRINTRHSDIFRQIGQDTNMLTSNEGAIQKIISKTNDGFEACNFVGVIQRIEMKMEESSNRIVRLLREIKSFKDEHEYDLTAESNLFSTDNGDRLKIQAVDLLRRFMKEMNAYRHDEIRLCDSFELKFRVIENQNDTGFVERLSNVGSEGTDVLVKAMINIMLLHVFKEGAAGKFKYFKLHCMLDEIGRLHPTNVKGILQFANERNILLINGSPTELNQKAYRHVYQLSKDAKSKTRVKRILSDISL